MPDRVYIKYFTETIRVAVHHDIAGPNVLSFSLQLEMLIDGYWHKIVRFDSAHGQPHKHLFYPDGQDYREPMIAQDNNQALTDANKMLEKTYKAICERYLEYKERMVK